MMKLEMNSLKNLEYKKFTNAFIDYYKGHNLTAIVLFAGLLVGFSLFRVNTLNKTIDNSGSSLESDEIAAEPLKLTNITFDEETTKRLESIASDEDVIINSNLPDNRKNPF